MYQSKSDKYERTFNYNSCHFILELTVLIHVLLFRWDRTARSQTTGFVKSTSETQIKRLLKSSLIRVYTVCHSISIFCTCYYTVKPHLSSFRMISTLHHWRLNTERHEALNKLFGLSFFGLFSSNFIFQIFFFQNVLRWDYRLFIHLTNYYFGILNCRALKISKLKFSLF